MTSEPSSRKVMIASRGAAEPISLGAAVLAGKKVAPDAINILVLDHMEARGFFARYQQSADPVEKLSVARRLCMLLSAHMQVEEEIFYPASREATGDEPMVEHAVHEHEEGKAIIAELLSRQIADQEADVLVERLRQTIEHHVMEEETSFFPEVRAAGALDLFELGRRVAARRVELLFERSDRNRTEHDMEAASDIDVGRAREFTRETDLTRIDPHEARALFVQGLRNIHAIKHNGQAMTERQIERLENYPKLKARLVQHREETNAQLQRIETILDGMDENVSGLKDAAMHMMGNMSAMINAAAGDEILKNSFATAGMVQFCISAYKSLLVMGEMAGETEAIRLLQQSLNEERSFAAWLEENLAGTVIMHMQLRSEGEQASH